MKPKLLDLFCGAGGAAMGYHRAGFEVVGVDIKPQPNFPFEFIQADAMKLTTDFLRKFHIITASPPCQRYSRMSRTVPGMAAKFPDLLEPVREMLAPYFYVIENVEGAPLDFPIMLCGRYFDLGTYRHRYFESNLTIVAPPHPVHDKLTIPVGLSRHLVKYPDDWMVVVAGHCYLDDAKWAMKIDWMKREEIREAIPPAYTEWIGKQILPK